jgi:hypothetical protein
MLGRMREKHGRWSGKRGMRWSAQAVGVVALIVACEEDVVRPAPIADCNDPACARNGVPVSIGSGTDLPDGEAGAGGGGGMPGPGVGTLAGSVLELAVSDLQTRQNLVGGVEVRAPRAGGAITDPVIDDTDPSGAFRLEGIAASSVTWVGVGNFQVPASEPYMDTIQAVNATPGDFVNLLVARRDAVRDAVSVGFMADAVEFDPTRAHILVRFIRESGAPIEGVRITFPLPEDVPTAYDAGDAFSSALEETSERGTALLLNMTAPQYPGVSTSIVADLDGEQLTAQLQIVGAALTVVSAVVPGP